MYIRYVRCYCKGIVLKPFQSKELGNIYLHICTCIHMYMRTYIMKDTKSLTCPIPALHTTGSVFQLPLFPDLNSFPSVRNLAQDLNRLRSSIDAQCNSPLFTATTPRLGLPPTPAPGGCPLSGCCPCLLGPHVPARRHRPTPC